MNIELVKELMNEFKDSDLTRIKLKSQEFELELERSTSIQVASAPMIQAPQVATAQINITEQPQGEVKVEGHLIKSPMVGTFYRASAPDQPEFVQIGTKVKKGDVICIIEAMKLMNEVEADQDGEIIEILVENEDMVEFDQPMFRIR
ncbi:acetyl-CoA carboxylase biotin carboxyl carrier protein [Niameybacter massiliensis]|uniref:Biotin carboxyl carrier protein of acetyl-CoA carboxylase n=1 Tax=Holtiella tumoricola TaxID=3018743 RepID=A0AA42IZH7_9FIRM|nr:acetyl-CoA carboxylase biotin carboxyl carrier protein [Holtiella tumoricola]MDA3730487.1 acetyl-CoA carboxylase biotin carboxyl carrier protein [Holtiella tumoricola]